MLPRLKSSSCLSPQAAASLRTHTTTLCPHSDAPLRGPVFLLPCAFPLANYSGALELQLLDMWKSQFVAVVHSSLFLQSRVGTRSLHITFVMNVSRYLLKCVLTPRPSHQLALHLWSPFIVGDTITFHHFYPLQKQGSLSLSLAGRSWSRSLCGGLAWSSCVVSFSPAVSLPPPLRLFHSVSHYSNAEGDSFVPQMDSHLKLLRRPLSSANDPRS